MIKYLRVIRFSVYFMFILFLVSCGRIEHVTSGDIGVEGEVKGSFGPDFKEAIRVCDDRYGKGSKSAEKCFLDYRNYFAFKLDLDSINEFCLNNTEDNEKADTCVKDLLDVILKSGKLE